MHASGARWLLLALVCCASFTTAMADGTYTIYPVPQEQVAAEGTAVLTADKIQVLSGSSIDEYTENRIASILSEHSLFTGDAESLFAETPSSGYSHIYVGVNGSGDLADQKASELGLLRDVFSLTDKYDKHIVSITSAADGSAEIIILGENTDAAFIGMASIEQILDTYSKQAYNIPCGTIYDYADQKNRGIVEGYYGVPYSIEVKEDLMRFMMRHKMNSYMYGAKSDPYHSTYWKNAYPTSITDDERELGYLSQDMIKELTEVAHSTKVNFIWAIHPGDNFLGSTTVVNDIMSKYKKMYDLGVRQFAIFVDDVSIPSTDSDYELNATRVTQVQQAMEAQWNKGGAEPADTVKPLQFVPQIYCSSFASGETQRKAFFTALSATPSNVAIYTTGWGVWSVPNTSDVEQVRQYLGRDVAWWWNYPCNDNDANKLFPMDMYSNFGDESKITSTSKVDTDLQNCLGVLSNPMQQGEVAKIALFGVADYAWNNDAFDNEANWNASFTSIVGDTYAEAYQKLCHYLRYYDSDALNQLVTRYKSTLAGGVPVSDDLLEELNSIVDAATNLEGLEQSDNESDRLLFKDLSPWLRKLKSMAQQAVSLIAAAEAGDDESKWNLYVPTVDKIEALSSDPAFYAPQLSGSVGSTLSLSTTEAMPSQEILRPFVTYMKENALGNLLDSESATSAKFFTNIDGGAGTINTLKNVVSFRKCVNTLQQGEYVGVVLPQPTIPAAVTVADTLLENFAVLYSNNGKDWQRLNSETVTDSYVKYVCVMNENSEPRSLEMTRSVFTLTLPSETKIASATIPSGTIYDSHTSTYMIDGDYTTYTCLNRNQQSGDAYMVDLGSVTTIGDVRICMGTVNGDYMTLGRVQVSEDGSKWTALKVKGTNIINYTMSLPQVVEYSSEMSYCDFDGAGASARYVRLYLTTPNTSKWLRLYDIEVNKQTYANSFEAVAKDADGNFVTTLDDELGYTGTDGLESLTYYFYNIYDAQSVTIFQDVADSISSPATLSVTDDGQEWVSLGQLTGGMQEVDLASHPRCRAIRIEWEEADAPTIYEIKEKVSDSELPVVSGIQNLSVSAASLKLTQDDNRLTLTSAAGIASVRVYTSDGKCLISQNLSGRKSAVVPIVAAESGVLIVKAVQSDGTESSFKIWVK